MERYRCAIIGCGGRAHGHAKAYQLIERGDLVACTNLSDVERRQKFALTYGLTGYADAKEMIEKERPDLIHIVTMPDQWVSLMQMVSDLGVTACLVEKPIACGVEDWQKLCQLEASSETKFGVGKQFRWHPRLLDCRQALRSGDLGDLLWINFFARMNLSAQGTHMIDWAMSLNDDSPVTQVFGNISGVGGFDSPYPAPDASVAQVMFANGVYGLWSTGFTAPEIIDGSEIYKHTHVTGYAERGHVIFEEFGRWSIFAPGDSRGGKISFEDRNRYNDVAQANLTNAMFQWIENDTKPVETNLKIALHQWNAVLGLYASAIYRQPIDIPFEPADDLLLQLQTTLKKQKLSG